MSKNKKFSELVFLAVDDELHRIEPILEELEQEVHLLYKSEDALEAFEIYRKYWKKIDYIILDSMMPIPDDWTEKETYDGQETGFALLKRMKEINPDVHVIVFTIFKRHSIHIEKYNNHIVLFLNKPISPRNFLSRLKQALKS